MNDRLSLRVPFVVSRADVQKAWLEQSKKARAVSRGYDQLHGAAQRAADQLNQVLDVDVFKWLTQGWAAVSAVRDAIEGSVQASVPPAILRLDAHNVASTSQLGLRTDVADSALPELELALQLTARIASATLAIKEGRIELLALGEAIFIAQLKYNDVLLRKHTTGIEGASRDPFRHHQVVSSSWARVGAHR